jgi:hypothetical protein
MECLGPESCDSLREPRGWPIGSKYILVSLNNIHFVVCYSARSTKFAHSPSTYCLVRYSVHTKSSGRKFSKCRFNQTREPPR